MVKIGKTDIRGGIRDFVREESKKQQKAEMDRYMKRQFAESYTDHCPYCGTATMVEGEKYSNNATVKEIGTKKYMVAPCSSCEKDIYVYLALVPPKSLLDAPSIMAYFYTEDQVFHRDGGNKTADGEKKLMGVVRETKEEPSD